VSNQEQCIHATCVIDPGLCYCKLLNQEQCMHATCLIDPGLCVYKQPNQEQCIHATCLIDHENNACKIGNLWHCIPDMFRELEILMIGWSVYIQTRTSNDHQRSMCMIVREEEFCAFEQIDMCKINAKSWPRKYFPSHFKQNLGPSNNLTLHLNFILQ